MMHEKSPYFDLANPAALTKTTQVLLPDEAMFLQHPEA